MRASAWRVPLFECQCVCRRSLSTRREHRVKWSKGNNSPMVWTGFDLLGLVTVHKSNVLFMSLIKVCLSVIAQKIINSVQLTVYGIIHLAKVSVRIIGRVLNCFNTL